MVEFECQNCGEHNSQSYEDISEKQSYFKMADNVVLLLTAWVKYDEAMRPLKGRTYCDYCMAPKDFVVVH